MKKRWVTMWAVLLALLLPVLAQAQETLFVRQVQDLPEDFILGMDVSSVLALEKAGVRYRTRDGREEDLFAILAGSGINWIRVRVWNDPYDAEGHGFGGGNCDVASAVEIGRRATAAGMRLLVDFHYSDFWADPSKQAAPRAWTGMKAAEKADALYAFTRDALEQMRGAGVAVGMVQLGNETNGKLAGESRWSNIVRLMSAGSRAVREVYPEAKVAVHFANPENSEAYHNYAANLHKYELDYDVFATSYYPYWHGTLDNLVQVLGWVRETYGKQVLIAETSYAWTEEDGDFSANTVGEGSSFERPWAFTPQGQVNALTDIAAAARDAGALGLFWWEGAWVPVGTQSWEENAALWERCGAGWASSYAAVYDPKDAGQYYGGCACENQALFDFTGRALPSLSAFGLLRQGQEAPLRADAVEPVDLRFHLYDDIRLPQTVQAVMNDNSRRDAPVVWEGAETLDASSEQKVTLQGKADGLTALCHVSVEAYNYVANGDFEGPDGGEWTAVDLSATQELCIEDKRSDSLSGTRHFHFFSAAKNTAAFSLSQTLTDLPAGTYRAEASIMGGDCGETDIRFFVRVNGEETAWAPLSVTWYNDWHTAVLSGLSITGEDSVTIGLTVRCEGSGNGAWGKIDDVKLVRTE